MSSEISEQIIDIDPPTVQDIKKPKKLVKKSLGLLELGAGAIIEQSIVQPLAAKIPIAPEFRDVIEILGLGLANSAVDQNDVNNVIGGATVNAVTRLSTKLIEKLKNQLKIGPGVKLTGQPVIQQQQYENYTEGDAF